MTKAKRMMQENIKLIDLVIELVDARIPLSSRNPDIDQLGANKARLILLNKADLADERQTAKWQQYFEKQGCFVVALNARNRNSMKAINGVVAEACKEKIERDRKRGILNRPVRAMVVGIPNVGKSTFINSFAGKACAKTGNKPGVTKGKQWIRLSKTLELLDTPGILWPKFEDQQVGLNLALIGSMNDEILNIEEMAVSLIQYLKDVYPLLLTKRYDLSDEAEESCKNEQDAYEVLAQIARNRKCVLKGDEPDIRKAAALLLAVNCYKFKIRCRPAGCYGFHPGYELGCLFAVPALLYLLRVVVVDFPDLIYRLITDSGQSFHEQEQRPLSV